MSTYSEYLDFLGHADNEARQQIDSQIESLRTEIKSQKTLLSKLQQERDGFSAELSKAKRQISEKNDELNVRVVEIEALKKAQQQKDADHQKQQNEMRTEAAKKLTDECLRMQKQHDEATEKLQGEHSKREEALKQKIDALTQEKVQLEGVLADERLKRSKQSAHYVDLKRDYEQLCMDAVDNAEKQKDAKRWEADYHALKEDFDKMQERQGGSDMRMAELQQKLAQANRQLDEATGSRRPILLKAFGYGAATICVLWFLVALIGRNSSKKPLQEEPTQRITYVEDTLLNGKKVTGYFDDGVLFYGTMTFDNGTVYTGHFEGSLPNGVGMEQVAEKLFVGQYVDGKKEGVGILMGKNQRMAGRFKQDGFVEDLQKSTPAYQDLEKARQAYADKDYKRAVELYTKPEVRKLMVAEDFFRMGYMVSTGNGTAKDKNAAACWYWVAAEQGHTIAMSNLAFLFWYGDVGKVDGKPNYSMAFHFWKRAYDQGSSSESTRYYIGRCYEEGLGVSKNIPQAIYFYEKAPNVEGTKERLEKLKKAN